MGTSRMDRVDALAGYTLVRGWNAMALTMCPDCNRNVSSAARTCPNCGHPGPFHAGEIAASGIPWRRFFARQLDTMVAMVILGTAALLGDPESLVGPEAVAAFAFGAVFIWAVIEAVLLAAWGTTPGKATLGLAVRAHNGEKLSFVNALARSFSVWAAGLGLGLPLVNVLTLALAYRAARDKDGTWWERKIAPTVKVSRPSNRGLLPAAALAGVCIVAFVALQGFATSYVQRWPSFQIGDIAADYAVAGTWVGRDPIRTYRLELQERPGGKITGRAQYADADDGIVLRPVSGKREFWDVSLVIQQPQYSSWEFRGRVENRGVMTGWWYIGGRQEVQVRFERK